MTFYFLTPPLKVGSRFCSYCRQPPPAREALFQQHASCRAGRIACIIVYRGTAAMYARSFPLFLMSGYADKIRRMRPRRIAARYASWPHMPILFLLSHSSAMISKQKLFSCLEARRSHHAAPKLLEINLPFFLEYHLMISGIRHCRRRMRFMHHAHKPPSATSDALPSPARRPRSPFRPKARELMGNNTAEGVVDISLLAAR